LIDLCKVLYVTKYNTFHAMMRKAVVCYGFFDEQSIPIFFGLLGFLAGATFSGVLGIVEGGRRFDQMSLSRFAGWGGLGGLLVSGILALVAGLGGEFLVLGPVFALAGAGCATGTLALARRAEQRELLDAGADVAEVGLNEGEAQELLGGRD
jgi:hypothetical protein